jgi:phosphatidylserine synthase
MLNSLGKTVYKNLANVVSILGVVPVAILFVKDGYQYLIPLIVYNNVMDDLDGILAAKLNIKSQFGAILDNVCDAIAHTVFVMVVGMQVWTDQGGVCGGVCAALSLVAATSLVLRVVSRLDPAAVTGTGSPTNELARHMLFILLLSQIFDFARAPLLIAAFVLHTVSMLVPYRMPWLIRSLTKSATAIGLLNVSLVVAWLVSYAPPLIAATFVSLIAAAFLLSYLLSFAWAAIWWIQGMKAGAPS